MADWIAWTIAGLVLAVGAGGFTIVWWKVGDRWADDEYKRFGHGGGGPSSHAGAKVIKDFDEHGRDEEKMGAGGAG